jgi:putative ABC transport system substrate-binding protein
VRRREFIGLLGGAMAWPLAARAQQQTKIARIGYLGFGTAAGYAPRVEALRTGLRDLGYVEGKNIVIEFRFADRIEHLQEQAAELARSGVNIIFATSSTEVEPARQATKTIPIVFATHADPVSVGHVASLARPGGNMTGLADLPPDLATKRLGIFKEALPHATRFGVLWSATAPSHRPVLEAIEPASHKLGLQLHKLSVAAGEEFEGALATMARERDNGVFVLGSALTTRDHRVLLAELALKHRLPTVFGNRENVVTGGLMSYGPDHPYLTRRAATYIDKILKGAKPADLPVEQASQYQLVINLKTAKALGLTVPPGLLARADEVIE